jgi:hypothetical protein
MTARAVTVMEGCWRAALQISVISRRILKAAMQPEVKYNSDIQESPAIPVTAGQCD